VPSPGEQPRRRIDDGHGQGSGETGVGTGGRRHAFREKYSAHAQADGQNKEKQNESALTAAAL